VFAATRAPLRKGEIDMRFRVPRRWLLSAALAAGLVAAISTQASSAEMPTSRSTNSTVANGGQSGAHDSCGRRSDRQEIRNRQLVHRYHVEVWEQGHFDRAADYLAPNFAAHSVPVLPQGQVPGPDFFIRFIGAFAPLSSHEDAILADCNRVALQWTITARQTGDFFGIPPTGRTIRFSGMDVIRVKDGKFTDQWGGIADQVDEVVAQLTSPA
jgi:predicted SnoaL-like aldol condensation-catalyzing enzyme